MCVCSKVCDFPLFQHLLTLSSSLLQTAADQQLEQAVTATFSQFGKVYVKIRRDGRGMPFAFAQYEVGNG